MNTTEESVLMGRPRKDHTAEFHLRVPDDMDRDIRDLAGLEHRSLNDQFVSLLAEAIPVRKKYLRQRGIWKESKGSS